MTTTPVKIILADDHDLVIGGVRRMLEGESRFEVVGQANGIRELVSVMRLHPPDVVVLDLNMNEQNSLDALPSLFAQFPRVKILILSSYNEPRLVEEALEKGASGYLLKNVNKSDFLAALDAAVAGKTVVGKEVHLLSGRKNGAPDEPFLRDAFLKKHDLSEREVEVIQLVAAGKTEQEIADALFLSKHTIHTHRKNVMRKLALHTGVDLVKFAYENGLA